VWETMSEKMESEKQPRGGAGAPRGGGRAEGEARGSRQKALETAKNLLHFGLSRENIAQATGLSPAEVEAL